MNNIIETRPLGWSPEKFSLPNVNGEIISLHNQLGENGLVVMFICNHCPYVIAVANQIVDDMKKLEKYNINSIAISSNDTVQYPEDSFENMKLFSKNYNFHFPYLFDESQDIAKHFKALCTPDFFGFNSKMQLQYRGRLNDCGKKQPNPETKNELVEAMKLISKQGIGPKEQFSSIGCSIKWKN